MTLGVQLTPWGLAAVACMECTTCTPTVRSKLKKVNLQERFILTLPKRVEQVTALLPKLVCADSTSLTVCLETGIITGDNYLKGPGPHQQMHAYAAITLGADQAGCVSGLLFVSNPDKPSAYTAAIYESEVRMHAVNPDTPVHHLCCN